MRLQLALTRRYAHGRAVLWRPLVAFLGVPWAVLGVLTWIRSELLPLPYRDWFMLRWLPSWSLSTWVIIALALLLLVLFEGSYRVRRGGQDLVGDIRRLVVGEAADGNGVGVSVVAQIRNLGPPTTLDGWSLQVVTPSGRTLIGAYVAGWNEVRIHGPGSQPEVYTREHDLMEQTIRQPLPNGSQVFGVAQFIIRGVSKEVASQLGTKVRLKFEDIRGNEYSMEMMMRAENIGRAPSYIPGIGPTSEPQKQ